MNMNNLEKLIKILLDELGEKIDIRLKSVPLRSIKQTEKEI